MKPFKTPSTDTRRPRGRDENDPGAENLIRACEYRCSVHSDMFLIYSHHMSTIFQKILDHEIPADVVYEDEHVLAFLDISPVNKGHTLVIPKVAFENIFDADLETFAHMSKVAVKIGQALKTALGCDGINLMMNNVVGQEVPHAHIHVIPRYESEHKITTIDKEEYADGEAAQVATQIQGALGTAVEDED